jgi:hypothetical protein
MRPGGISIRHEIARLKRHAYGRPLVRKRSPAHLSAPEAPDGREDRNRIGRQPTRASDRPAGLRAHRRRPTPRGSRGRSSARTCLMPLLPWNEADRAACSASGAGAPAINGHPTRSAEGETGCGTRVSSRSPRSPGSCAVATDERTGSRSRAGAPSPLPRDVRAADIHRSARRGPSWRSRRSGPIRRVRRRSPRRRSHRVHRVLRNAPDRALQGPHAHPARIRESSRRGPTTCARAVWPTERSLSPLMRHRLAM